jgi:maleate isomerase
MSTTVPRIGLIIPSSNTVMERDFHRALGDTCAVGSTRIFLEDVTREAEERMLAEELPAAFRLLRTLAPDVVVFGCTSAGSLGGVDQDPVLARRVGEETGGVGVTVVGSVLAELRAIRPARVAVFTPYTEALTRSVAACVADGGFAVSSAAGMGIVENRGIGAVPPDEIVRFVEASLRGSAADCVFLSCTNWQAVEAIPALSSRLGLPVVSSNQASIAAVRRLVQRSPSCVPAL